MIYIRIDTNISLADGHKVIHDLHKLITDHGTDLLRQSITTVPYIQREGTDAIETATSNLS